MAKGIKPTKSKVKTDKKKRKDIQDEYHKDLPDSERNPNHKKDFEDVLKKLFPEIKVKKEKK